MKKVRVLILTVALGTAGSAGAELEEIRVKVRKGGAAQAMVLEEVRAEIIGIESELNRRRYLKAPELWIEERLGEQTWSKQKEILRSVVENRRTAVPSCFGSGKSWTAARLSAWWIDVHAPGKAFVVTTATTGAQVKAILWRELGRAHAAGNLAGRLNQTEWWLPVNNGREEIVAFGRKPRDMDQAAFQGIHAPYVLVILDEAAGIPTDLFEAADSLIVNEDSRILAIGNPEDLGEFKEVCSPGSGWNVIRIPAKVTPNFTNENIDSKIKRELISKIWVEEKRKKWGMESPLYKAKVDAEFPDTRIGGLISISLVRAAQDRELEPGEPNELGVDVGGGGDSNVTAQRRGSVVRIIRQDKNPDTMQTCSNVLIDLRTTGATVAKVDEIGIGRGVVDRGKELGKPVVGVNVGREAENKQGFANLRAEGFWALRERFEQENIDLSADDDDLAAQLIDIKYKPVGGRIQIESKDEIRRRNKGESPDESDAVMLAFLQVRDRTVKFHELSEF